MIAWSMPKPKKSWKMTKKPNFDFLNATLLITAQEIFAEKLCEKKDDDFSRVKKIVVGKKVR